MYSLVSRKGQTVMPEYVVGFFLVIAATIGMSLFVQRAMQARVRDAKLYMVNQASNACVQADAMGGGLDCQGAVGAVNGKINAEYEPYYSKISTLVDRSQEERKTVEIGSVFRKNYQQNMQMNSYSEQLPPEKAN